MWSTQTGRAGRGADGGGRKLKVRRMLEIVPRNLADAERSCVMRVVSAVRGYATFSDSVLVSALAHSRTHSSPEALGVTEDGTAAKRGADAAPGGRSVAERQLQRVASLLGPVVSAPSASTLRAHLDSTPAG